MWEKAKEKTEVLRGRAKGLSTFKKTDVPYVFLGESSVNEGHTVIRKGKVVVERPVILLPENTPFFEGFDFEGELHMNQDAIQMFLFMRGIRFPSLKYNHTGTKLDLSEDSLSVAAEKMKRKLEKEENVTTALILGPEDCWQFSVLLYIAGLVGRCARLDMQNLIDRIADQG